MKNGFNFWELKSLATADENFRRNEEFIKKLKVNFDKAIFQINRDVSYYLERIGADIRAYQGASKQLTKEEQKHLKMSVLDFLQNNFKYMSEEEQGRLINMSDLRNLSRLDAIGIEMTKHVDILFKNYYKESFKELKNIYEETYYKSIFNYQSLLGYKQLDGYNPRKFEVIMNYPFNLDDRAFKETVWGNANQLVKELQTTLEQGLVQGLDNSTMAKLLAKRVGVSYSRAKTLIVTSTTYVTSEAMKDTIVDIGTANKYEISATLDNRTSLLCQNMDTKIFDIKDFRPGITAPPFHRNCRTVIVPYFEDNIMSDGRAGRDRNGKTIKIPAMNYYEWKKKYVN